MGGDYVGGSIVLVGGGTPKTTISEYWGGNIPWLSVVDFNNDQRWVSRTEKTITEEGLNNSSTKLLNAGDLIISARGTVGALAQLKINMTFNQSCYGIKEKEGISAKDFLYYLLKFSLQQIGRNVHGAVFDTITRQTFDNINILLPPLPEQKAIASILSSFDDKIELLREQNKTLEATAQTIFKEWFGKYGVDDKLPEGWRVGKLGETIDSIESGSRPKGGIDPNLKNGIPSLGAESINGLGVYKFSKTKYISKDFFQNVNRGKVNSYDILIYKDGAYVGKKGMFGLGFPFETFLINEHVFILRNENVAIQFWLYLSLKEIDLAQLNTNSAQPGLNQSAMRGFEIVIPDTQVLEKFAILVKDMFDKIFENGKQIQSLSKTRNVLLPKLMKGENS